MKDRDEKTQSHHRRTHEAYDVPAGVPGPPRRRVVAPTRPRTRGAGERTADALHDADLVRYQDTPAIALSARVVTAGTDLHPFGALCTKSGHARLETGIGRSRWWPVRLGRRSGRRRCPLRHPGTSRTGAARLAHLGGTPRSSSATQVHRARRADMRSARPTEPATGWDDRSPTSRSCWPRRPRAADRPTSRSPQPSLLVPPWLRVACMFTHMPHRIAAFAPASPPSCRPTGDAPASGFRPLAPKTMQE